MKHIIFLRHAHTEAFHMKGDHARELSTRGVAQAEQIAPLCDATEGLRIILASGAVRTLQTAEVVQRCSRKVYKIIPHDSLYLASASEIFNVIAQQDNAYDTLMLIGHNPGIADAIEQLLGADIWYDVPEGVPPCSFIHITSETARWQQLEASQATLHHYATPAL
jgi:phosphohistidine phosphatase